VMRQIGEAEVKRIMDRFASERPGFPMPRAALAEYQDFRRFVLVDDVDGVKLITIRRPQAMNALNEEITNEILEVLKKYNDDLGVKGFVITGYGTAAFSAGADIGRFPRMLGDKESSIAYARECAEVQRFMDKMEKPVVAAVNGMALGGGLEVAIRCHSMVATKNAFFQFPEITLGILPGIGGCVVPYRRWPQGAALFHDMICLGRPMKADEALEVGMVAGLANDYNSLIRMAVDEVKNRSGDMAGIQEGKVDIPDIVLPDPPVAGKQPLSREAVAIVERTVRAGAAADSFDEALEIGYKGFGEIACTDAAREGITAFLEKRKPQFTK
jgi:enoyl-CoA hydratase / 3-hydroxyacyl-CoA dehydrogenase